DGLETVVLFDLIAVVLDEIRRLLDVADTLEPVLAGLVAHQRRQLPASCANGAGDFLEQRDTRSPWLRAPRRKRRSGGSDRVANLLPARALESSEQNPGVDRAAILKLGGGTDVVSVDHERVAPAERSAHLLDRSIEFAMQLVHLIAAHRRVSYLLHGFGDLG